MQSIWLGYDSREVDAFVVATESLKKHNATNIPVKGILLSDQIKLKNYKRPYRKIVGSLFDEISQAAMSTEFALTRFLTPALAKAGWALFCDCDVMFRSEISELFSLADDRYAVQVVKHRHIPKESVKMDNQPQQPYPRKNWSSVMLFNCDHPSNKKLTLDLINSKRGAELHAFCWLEDHEIGELNPEWNYLEGYSTEEIDPKIVHFTLGTPLMLGCYNSPHASEWLENLHNWARG